MAQHLGQGELGRSLCWCCLVCNRGHNHLTPRVGLVAGRELRLLFWWLVLAVGSACLSGQPQASPRHVSGKVLLSLVRGVCAVFPGTKAGQVARPTSVLGERNTGKPVTENDHWNSAAQQNVPRASCVSFPVKSWAKNVVLQDVYFLGRRAVCTARVLVGTVL